MEPPTPYDNGIGLWHHWGYVVSQITIDDFARQIRQRAPAVTAVYIKTHHGSQWQGTWDKSPHLAVTGPASIDQWVEGLARHGLDFHAWCVPQGLDIAGEAQRIIEVCNRPGVRSCLLDVEPFNNFYEGSPATIRPLMTRVRTAIPAGFHFGFCVDPRPQHYRNTYPSEWFPFVSSVHPQCYWETFSSNPDDTLRSMYNTWSGFGRPIFPVLQVLSTPERMNRARTVAVQTHGASGVSWWQMSQATTERWTAINVRLDGTSPQPEQDENMPPTPTPEPPPAGTIIVRPGDAGYRDGTYDGTPVESLLRSAPNAIGGTMRYKSTTDGLSNVWTRWDPGLTSTRWYEVAAFVPGQNATTFNARYKLHNTEGRVGEIEIAIAQYRFSDSWVPLGTFYFNAHDPQAGVVFLNDLTGEKNRLIAFDAIRWRPVDGPTTDFRADGFDSPVGTGTERRTSQVWPGRWFDATGYDVLYQNGTAYHTGADLNLNFPTWDTDRLAPVFAAASGEVTRVEQFPVWGWIIIIRHDPLITTGQVVHARYAHIARPLVQQGQRVQRGEQIASIGNADGTQPYHLHFDISPTDVLRRLPAHWPKLNRTKLQENYIDPRDFIRRNRPRF